MALAIKKVAEEMGLPEHLVQRAFELAVEEGLSKFFQVANVTVDLERRTADVVFVVPIDMEILDASFFDESILKADPLLVVFDLAAFPEKVVKDIRKVFDGKLNNMLRHMQFEQWKTHQGEIVKGVISRVYPNHIRVDLPGDIEGVLYRPQMVNKEIPEYKPGLEMSFYVSKVTRDPFSIQLSRNSKNFLTRLLSDAFPWSKFQCVFRYAGQKSVVSTDAPINKVLKTKCKEIRATELFNEIVVLQNFS